MHYNVHTTNIILNKIYFFIALTLHSDCLYMWLVFAARRLIMVLVNAVILHMLCLACIV